MNKPTVFFSHSSKDKEVLSKLKDVFSEKTGGTIDVFLSSDGQSIPLGRNWVHRVQEALEQSSLMVVFITPNSLRSSWIYFEAGFAYSKGIRVIPVGFLGTDLSHISPPLNLLQGFNINNKDGLDNLIALVNEAYSYKLSSTFTEDDYKNIISFSDNTATHPFGDYLPLIEEVYIEINDRDHFEQSLDEGLGIAKAVLNKLSIEYHDAKDRLETFGLTISVSDGQLPKAIQFELDPILLETTLPLALQIIAQICSDGIEKVSVRFDFISNVDCQRNSHKRTARLFGSGITFAEDGNMVFQNLSFSISHLMHFSRSGLKQGSTYLAVTAMGSKLDICNIFSLLKMLFERKVLFAEEQWETIGS